MQFTQSNAGTIATNGGSPTNTFVSPAASCRVGTSQPRPRTAATPAPKLPVQFGTELKSSARSCELRFLFCGVVKNNTSSRASPCIGSPTSRTLAGMKSQLQLIYARRPRLFSHSQNQSAVRQTPVPNPSIERTRTGRPRMASISFWAMRALPARAAHVKRWAS